MTSVEQLVNPDPLKKPELSQGEKKEDALKSLQDYLDTKQNGKKIEEIDIQKVTKNIVFLQLSPAELEGILSKLPLDKRFIVEKMILDEQKNQIMTMSQEKYKQYLQAQFPSGVPTNVGEMALSMVSDTSEMYKVAQQEIEKTDAGENPSKNAQQQLKEDRAIATGAANKAKNDSEMLAQNIAMVPDKIQRV